MMDIGFEEDLIAIPSSLEEGGIVPFEPESFPWLDRIRALFIEIGCMILSGLLMPFGWVRPFDWNGMNPTVLTAAQKQQPAILLLHGSSHNESAFLFLGKRLVERNAGPVFSCHYDSSNLIEAIEEKLQQIASLYQTEAEVICIGHSLGAIGASYVTFVEEDRIEHLTIRKVISIGGRLMPLGNESNYEDVKELVQRVGAYIEEHHPANLCTISAAQDWLVPFEASYVGGERVLVSGVSHLSLLYDSRVEDQILSWLPSNEYVTTFA